MSILDENLAQGPNTEGGLRISGEIKHSWMITSKWTQYLTVLGFIYVGLVVLVLASMSQIIALLDNLTGNVILNMLSAYMPFITALTAISVLIQFFAFFYLQKFTSQIQQAVRFGNQTALENAWRSLRNHLMIFAILAGASLLLSFVFRVILMQALDAQTLPVDNGL
jgi:hypothetical protein